MHLPGFPSSDPSRVSSARPIVPAFHGFTGEAVSQYFGSLGMKFMPHEIQSTRSGSGNPDQDWINYNMRELSALDPAPVVYIDVETLPMDIRTHTTAQVDSSIAYFEQAIGFVRAANPAAKVGLYNMTPVPDYFTPNNLFTSLRYGPGNPSWGGFIDGYSVTYQGWVNANAYLAPLAQACDYIFTSLYVPYTKFEDLTSDGWPTFAFCQLAESRKYGKPIYPFLWPQFNTASDPYMSDAVWQKVINLTRRYADGMVIWGYGPFFKEKWAPGAFWWQDVLNLSNSLSTAPGFDFNTGLLANPFPGVYSNANPISVSLSARGSRSIYYSTTTSWPNFTYPDSTTGTLYSGPISVASSEVILATAYYPDGSFMNQNFPYALKAGGALDFSQASNSAWIGAVTA